ncbi:MAG TPA: hypothetical protein PK177_09280, partial [Burkholderiaceae bacterium]|nr:hypothetical protein [Burkholderiaceae bacterium]
MATPNDRKRVSLVPDVPAYDPAAAAAPTTPRSRPGSALDRLGGAIRRTPGEVADYARDVVRNPLRELGTATAPLVGAGGSVRTAAAGLRSLPSRAALAQSQVQAGQVLRNARPSLGQLFSGGAASAGLALGIDDAAHKEQQAAAARPEFSNVVSGANSMPAVISPTSTAAGDAYVQVGDRQPRRIRVSQAERD